MQTKKYQNYYFILLFVLIAFFITSNCYGAEDKFRFVKIKPGDSISGLCKKYYKTYSKSILNQILEFNPQIKNPRRINVGQTLLFPKLSSIKQEIQLEEKKFKKQRRRKDEFFAKKTQPAAEPSNQIKVVETIVNKIVTTPTIDFAIPLPAKIVSFKGLVFVKSGSREHKVNMPNLSIKDGDIIITKQGKAKILYDKDSIINIDSNTKARFLFAEKSIAKVDNFTGDVFILRGNKIRKVVYKQQPINQGDIIQTKKGSAKILFADGSTINVSPFTNISIRQREEEVEGGWVGKSKNLVRRITCFVGKLRFKSGKSKIKNYLQTPNAIAGIRGSEGDISFDNKDTFLKMYTGSAKTIGNVKDGILENQDLK